MKPADEERIAARLAKLMAMICVWPAAGFVDTKIRS